MDFVALRKLRLSQVLSVVIYWRVTCEEQDATMLLLE